MRTLRILVALNLFRSTMLQQCIVPPVRLHPHQCCNIPMLFDETKLARCRVKYPSYQNHQQTASHCFLTCALEAADVSQFLPSTVDGLTRAVTATFITNNEYKLATVITNAIFTCLNAPSTSQQILSRMSQVSEYICDPNSLLVKGCINILIASNCPENRQTKVAGCNEWRSYWQQCKPPNVI